MRHCAKLGTLNHHHDAHDKALNGAVLRKKLRPSISWAEQLHVTLSAPAQHAPVTGDKNACPCSLSRLHQPCIRVIGWFSPNACRSKSIPYLRGRVGRGSGPRGIHTARSKRILKNGKLQRLASGLHLTAWREFVDDLWNIPAEHLGELLPIDIPLACQFIDFTSSKHILDLTTVDRLVRAGSHP